MSNLNICVNNTQIKRVQHTKSLGITIDENLTWKNHVDVICKKVSSGIGALKRVRRFMFRETAEKAYRGLLEPYFNYCCPVWDGIGSQLSSKLQKTTKSCCSYDCRMHIRNQLELSIRGAKLVQVIS